MGGASSRGSGGWSARPFVPKRKGVLEVKLSQRALILALLLSLVLALGLVAGCGGGDDDTAAPAGDGTDTTEADASPTGATGETVELKVGAAGPFTGQLAKIGTDALQAIRMAVEDFNDSGAMPGVTFTVVEADDAADPAKAATVAEKLSSDDAVVGVIGPMTSSAVKSSLPIYEEGMVPMVSQSATNDELSESGYSVFHRICPKDGIQGPSIAKFMVEDLDVKSAFLIDDKGTYSQGLADQVEKALKDSGVTDIQRESITPEDKDFSAVLTKVKGMNPDILFAPIPSPAQGAALEKQMLSMGFDVPAHAADGAKDPTEFIANAGGATEGTYATSLGPMAESVPAAQDFLERYTAKYKETSLFTAQSYEATMVLLEAVKTAGVADGKVDREAINAALGETDYTGILGFPISFTSEGDLAAGGIYIIQVQGSEFVPVKAIELD
jgi:branched-chain amino acid transport system substrate-binding protein